MAHIYNKAQRTEFFRNMGLGHLSHRKACEVFQRAYNLGTWLEIDGDFGARTTYAAEKTKRHGYKISANFHWKEFYCGCDKKRSGCQGWQADRKLLHGLENLRKNIDGPVPIVSGYRCPSFNRSVGGHSNSLHMEGRAVDIPHIIKIGAWPRQYAYMNRIGYRSHGYVTHVGYKPGAKFATFKE